MRAVKNDLPTPSGEIEESECARSTRAIEERPGYPLESDKSWDVVTKLEGAPAGIQHVPLFGSCFRPPARKTSAMTHAHIAGALWCKMVYPDFMSLAEKTVRQSVSLPAHVARRVKSLAKTSSKSANRIIVDLIESGIEARERERKLFFELADRLARSSDAGEQKLLKEELARMTFGE